MLRRDILPVFTERVAFFGDLKDSQEGGDAAKSLADAAAAVCNGQKKKKKIESGSDVTGNSLQQLLFWLFIDED